MGCSLTLDCLEALSKIDNIVGIKEASGNISFAAKVAKLCNENFCMMSGMNDMIIPIMSLGGTGVISVFANLCPRETHDMVAAWLNGDVALARDMQLKYLDLINALFIEVNPIPIKEAMNLRGMNVGGYRLPLYEMDEKNRAVLIVQKLKILEDEMKVILCGYGKMGRMIEQIIAQLPDMEILGIVHPGLYNSPLDVPGKADVIIDFSYPGNLESALARAERDGLRYSHRHHRLFG